MAPTTPSSGRAAAPGAALVAAALEARLEGGGSLALVTAGTSMHPYLQAGDRVLVEAIPPERLRLGDVLAFRRGPEIIVHRFAGRAVQDGRPMLREKGDHLRGFTWIPEAALVGRVVRVEGPRRAWSLTEGAGLRRCRFLGVVAWTWCQVLPLVGLLSRCLRWLRTPRSGA
jgi:signal peptidase I